MMAFLRLIRIGNLFIIALSLSLFYYLILVPQHRHFLNPPFGTPYPDSDILPFSNLSFALFVFSVMCIAAAGNVINDYFDFELDKQFKPERPLPSGKISLDAAMYIHAAFAFIGIGIGFYLGYKTGNYKLGYLYVLCTVLLYLYSAFLKKIPVIGNIIVSALTAFVFVMLWVFDANFLAGKHFAYAVALFNLLTLAMGFYAGFAFITNLAREVVKDIEDSDGDSMFNINTFPVMFGDTVGKILTSIILVATACPLAYFAYRFAIAKAYAQSIYFIIALVLPAFILAVYILMANTKKSYSRVSLGIKILMLLGILSIPVFYLLTNK